MNRENYITVDGVALSYEEYGAGKPLVFVHGLAASSFSWRRTAQALSDNWRAICFDLMGFGLSDKPQGEQYTLERQSELILGAIRQMGLERPALIGHSLGGGVCLSAMRRLGEGQDRVSALVLVDSVCYPQPLPWFVSALKLPVLPRLCIRVVPERWGFRLVARTMYGPRNGISAEALDDYARALASPGAHDALIATAKQIIPPDIDELIDSYSRISTPTQIIWGAQDRLLPIHLGRRLAQAITGARFNEVDDCGHCPQEERPEEVVGILRVFLEAAA